MKETAKGNVSLYVVLMFTLCALTYFFRAGSMAVMWSPAVAAIIVSLLRRRSLKEIGWRGFLVPELAKWMSFRKTALVSGAIWCVWHMPPILSGSYGTTDTPRWYQIGCFSAMVLSSAVVLAWLRMKSGSIWPVTIMHATHNGVIQAFFDRITKDSGHTHYFSGEFGVALVLPFAALAFYCITNREGSADANDVLNPSLDGRMREQLLESAR